MEATKVQNASSDATTVHELTGVKSDSEDKIMMSKLLPLTLVVIIVGIASGYIISSQKEGSSSIAGKQVAQAPTGEIKKGQVFGSVDEKAFRDQAQGKLEKGGLESEGSHKLIREGGESQTAYLTSSTLDLDQFVGKKVKVWGETYKASKAGWFMDVGRVEILE